VPDTPLCAGQRVRGYLIVRCVGQGGMGEVYEVEHRALGRRCVLKMLHRKHAARADLAEQMRLEARVLASIHHENLVEVYDLGTSEDGRPYFVMELLRGNDLRRELGRLGPLAVPSALALTGQALLGLAAAHGAGVVHGDVKLDNLLLCEDGALRVLDFGLGVGQRAQRAAGPLCVAGTPRTMAPEQCRGETIDARTDVYGVGLVLYELIAGRGPFDDLRGDLLALRRAQLEREPAPPSRLAPQRVSPSVDEAVLRAIAKDPAERFQSAREMLDALLSLRGERRRRSGAPPAPRSWEDGRALCLATEPLAAPAPLSPAAQEAPTEPDAPVVHRRRRSWASAAASAVVVMVALATVGAIALGASRSPPSAASAAPAAPGCR
jgi:serine/threonine protein kinase